ncbi:hypothetical protein [Mesorhizobium sp.]|uniref:hypothetical protein n=1 Tax=Mesorhizobium sp. TaxID=1871066 RepID=UPI000FE54638|nr:hypothetical protein [Mesorhizobium sp.]RWI35414.1 MAG: hypothetical protein EOR14_28335 [Mesorhizobium sp.]RWJ66417.1 MAG: hypothetical protein EOR34_28800 [Mesorhizobium sp.]
MSEDQVSGAEEPAEDEDEKKGRRLTDAERAEIRETFELGQAGIVELSEKYGVTRQALSKWFKKDGITKGSRAHEVQAAINNSVKAAIGSAVGAAVAEQIERFSEKRLEWIEDTRVSAIKDLNAAKQIARKIMAEAIRDKKAPATIDDDLKALHRYQKIIEQNADAKLRILRSEQVVDENDLPKLQIEDLTAEQLVEFHRDNGVEDEDEIEQILESFAEDPVETP